MPVNPVSPRVGGFGGGAQQLLARAQQQSGTKGGGILDSIIGQAFGMLMQRYLNPQTPTDDSALNSSIVDAYKGVGAGRIGNETSFLNPKRVENPLRFG